jgi:hypothetical protein
MLVMFLLAALGASIPQADINKICEGAKVGALPADRVSALRSCIGDETSARDQIKREWNRFTVADRSNCAPTPTMEFSYVELLTCLEMQRGGGNLVTGSQAGSPMQQTPLLKPSSDKTESSSPTIVASPSKQEGAIGKAVPAPEANSGDSKPRLEPSPLATTAELPKAAPTPRRWPLATT